jgi:signal transduction histidine kinase
MMISIRTKIIVGQLMLVALVSVFIYTYYPTQQRKLALQAIDGKIKSIANMFSIGVGIGMGETDFVAVSEALNWANSDSSVTYVSVKGNQQESIALHNPKTIAIPLQVADESVTDIVMEVSRTMFLKAPILYQNEVFGSLIIGYSLKNLDHNLSEIKKTTLLFCLVLFTVGVVFSVVVANMISVNITKLGKAVQLISTGSEDVRVDVKTNDEIGELGKAFNGMLDKIENSRKELLTYSTQLKKQNDELNQFSYVVSHDLKAPLRAIFKLSEWIEEDLKGSIPEEPKKNLQILRGRVFRMEALINGLLEYSKVGRLHVPAEKTDVFELIKEVVDLLNPPPHVSVIIGKDMPVFKTKKLALQQVFLNLISNAIKYNDKEAGIITITVLRAGSFFQFTVSDNGVGIDKAYHEKIFSIFQTLEARDKVESTGIGLSIVKKIIEESGGMIRVESEAGKGASFVFTWPTT